MRYQETSHVRALLLMLMLPLLLLGCKKEAGEPCEKKDNCKEGLVCLHGSCFQLKDAGGACEQQDQCLDGLVCLKNQCFRLRDEGSACEAKDQCLSGLACRKSECFRLREAGSACEVADQCVDGLVCLDKACFALLKEGEACKAREACQAGLTCLSSKCVTAKQEGQACEDHMACDQGLFCLLDACIAEKKGREMVASAPASHKGFAAIDAQCKKGDRMIMSGLRAADFSRAEAGKRTMTKASDAGEELYKKDIVFARIAKEVYESIAEDKLLDPDTVNFCQKAFRKEVLARLKAFENTKLP
jgi:hypothetical protein